MKDLGLQELLRYAFSGAIGPLVFLSLHPFLRTSFTNFVKTSTTPEMTLGFALVLLIGTIIYNIHRALLFPIVFRIVGCMALRPKWSWWLLNFWRPSQDEIQVDRWRWGGTRDARNRWGEWGAQTHFLYCAAWSVFAALIASQIFYRAEIVNVFKTFWTVFGMITLSAGLTNNYRLLCYLREERSASEVLDPSQAE